MRKRSHEIKPSPAIVITVLTVGFAVAGIALAAPQQAPDQGFAWKDGAEVYAKICAHCHESGVGPVIRGRGLAPAVISYFVRHGSRAMPAFRAAEIDDGALAKLADYIAKN
jgi:4-cresol dehydrogenase (hydroxylating) cytochrome subunit